MHRNIRFLCRGVLLLPRPKNLPNLFFSRTTHTLKFERCKAKSQPLIDNAYSRKRFMTQSAACQHIKSVPEFLDKDQFSREYTVKALRLPKQCCNKYMQLLRGVVLARPKVKAVVMDKDDPGKRILLLEESVCGLGDAKISQDIKDALASDGCEEVEHIMKEDYTLLSTEAVLKRILPEGYEVPGSFETIGHIAHLNLKPEQLPYKHLIGQVIIDKNNCISTVVNKVGILENEYRVLPLEVIAGEDRLEAIVNQHRARFKVHFGEVYWNSRLEEEHRRLTQDFKAGQIVADVMAGVGPFAVPAAQRGCQVYANDLNPRSYHYLKENIKLNKVSEKVKPSQLDGRQFIREIGGAAPSLEPSGGEDALEHPVGRDGSQNQAKEPNGLPLGGVVYHHAIMNLPASAVEFLDAYKGSFSRKLWAGHQLPLVHVYTFARTAESESDIRLRVEKHLGGVLDQDAVRIRLVRDVAPNKRMVCVTFRVPAEVAFCSEQSVQKSNSEDSGSNSARKKAKHS